MAKAVMFEVTLTDGDVIRASMQDDTLIRPGRIHSGWPLDEDGFLAKAKQEKSFVGEDGRTYPSSMIKSVKLL
jgi:hypothetical protein